MKPSERFWRFVDKDGPIPAHMPHLGNCWIWTGHKQKRGYGMFRSGQRAVLAHRFSLSLSQDISLVKSVCHRCDNPSCVRPDHLVAADQFWNMSDAVAKGRLCPKPAPMPGESAPNHKLTTVKVQEILSEYASGGTSTSLAGRFNVTKGTVLAIVNRKTWRHLGEEKRNRPTVKLTAKQVLEIRSTYTGAYGQISKLARQYGVSTSTMFDVVKGITHIEVI